MVNIIVVANIIIKEQYKDEVYNALLELHKQTHKNDKGCIQYELHKNLEKENSFTFIETWENATLLEEHSKKEHFVNFVQFIDGKIEEMSVKKLEKIDI